MLVVCLWCVDVGMPLDKISVFFACFERKNLMEPVALLWTIVIIYLLGSFVYWIISSIHETIKDLRIEQGVKMPEWYEQLKKARELLKAESTDREHAIAITMLEQLMGFCWLWIVKK